MNELPYLNYQHLYYFMTIVKEGGVTAAARQLRLSQSTLSAQLKSLENALGKQLFKRENRRLVLSSDGQLAMSYAEEIFKMGDEFRHRIVDEDNDRNRVIRIGSLSPLSKNLQFEIIKPLVMESVRSVRVVEGEYADLLNQLKQRKIDILLSNIASTGLETDAFNIHLLGEMAMYLVGRPPFKIEKKKFPYWLKGIPLFLPSTRTLAREGFDALLIRSGVHPVVRAEIDDTALLRLLALSGAGIALIPEIGVKFELEEQKLLKIEKVNRLYERYYAITYKQKRIPQSILDIIELAQRNLA